MRRGLGAPNTKIRRLSSHHHDTVECLCDVDIVSVKCLIMAAVSIRRLMDVEEQLVTEYVRARVLFNGKNDDELYHLRRGNTDHSWVFGFGAVKGGRAVFCYLRRKQERHRIFWREKLLN